MEFTFGIITAGSDLLKKVLSSIYSEMGRKKDFEIIVIGGSPFSSKNLTHIPFDETVKPDWISKKKNIIAQNAKYDNLVMMHDYYELLPGWYKGFVKFGSKWDICMTVIENLDGTRYRDWVSWNDPEIGKLSEFRWMPEGVAWAPGTHHSPIAIVPYDYKKTENLLIDGGYWVCKKQVMLDYPINESRLRGQGEDIEWTKRVREKCTYRMNTFSKVKLLKYKLTQAKVVTYAEINYI